MAYAVDSLKLISEHRAQMARSFAEGRCCDAQGKALRIVLDYLDFLEQELSLHTSTANVSQVQEMLLEVSCIIRRAAEHIEDQEYRAILQRLVGLYAKGLSRSKEEVFSITAADYADVIEAISRAFPDYDYSEAIGQLLFYMNHLYQLRKNSWVTVYEHLLSMPDSIKAIQMLKEKHFLEIQGWAEEGVHNLFGIHRDLSGIIAELSEEISALDKTLREREEVLEANPCGGNVVCLGSRRKRIELDALEQDRQRLLEEREGKIQVAELIEVNIREFEAKLKEARRAYFVRLVYDASHSMEFTPLRAMTA